MECSKLCLIIVMSVALVSIVSAHGLNRRRVSYSRQLFDLKFKLAQCQGKFMCGVTSGGNSRIECVDYRDVCNNVTDCLNAMDEMMCSTMGETDVTEAPGGMEQDGPGEPGSPEGPAAPEGPGLPVGQVVPGGPGSPDGPVGLEGLGSLKGPAVPEGPAVADGPVGLEGPGSPQGPVALEGNMCVPCPTCPGCTEECPSPACDCSRPCENMECPGSLTSCAASDAPVACRNGSPQKADTIVEIKASGSLTLGDCSAICSRITGCKSIALSTDMDKCFLLNTDVPGDVGFNDQPVGGVCEQQNMLHVCEQ